MRPAIKYVGGKTKLLDNIKRYLPEDCGTIVEPFCGSAAFSLSTDKPFFLMDASPELINYHHVLMHDVENLITRLIQIEADQSQGLYYELRKMDRTPDFPNDTTELERAARYHYIKIGRAHV